MRKKQTRNYIKGVDDVCTLLARELHDGVCNDLLALEMKLKKLSHPQQESATLSEALVLLEKTRSEIRHISHELMSPALQYATIDEILRDYAAHLSTPFRLSYTSDASMDWGLLPADTGHEIYRIVQEAMMNIQKHAEATQASISLSLQHSLLTLTVTDNGNGFNPLKKEMGIGLRTIYERVISVGGMLNIESGAKGTTLIVRVAVKTSAPAPPPQGVPRAEGKNGEPL